MNRIERKLYELLCRKSINESPSIDNVLQSKVKNTVTGNDVKVASALSYKNTQDPGKRSAYQAAVGMLKKAGADEKDIKSLEKKEKSTSEKEPKAKPAPKPAGQPAKQEPQKIKAADFKSAAEKEKEPASKGPKGAVDKVKLKQLMPGMDTTKKSVNDVPPEARKEAVTAIDKISADLIKAKETGGKAENTNLCKVSIPGTNLYCDGNKNIPRDQMPQFRGKPEPGSQADKMPRDKNGEVETSQIFDQMLEKEGIKISEPTAVPPDSLKATQSELVGPKVVGMMGVLEKDCNSGNCNEKDAQDYKNITDPIYVSNDGYVVDGHHRWAAIVSHNVKNPDKQIPMNVRVIDDKIDSVIPKANKFAQDIGIAAKSGKEGTKGGPPAAQTNPVAEKKNLSLGNLLKARN